MLALELASGGNGPYGMAMGVVHASRTSTVNYEPFV